MMVALLFISLAFMLCIGVPVYLCLALSALLTLIFSGTLPPEAVAQRMFSGVDKFSLMSVPFFIFAANIMNRGGLAPRIVAFTNTLVGHVNGGMAQTVVLACMFLGAVSGSAPATVVAICALMLKMMTEAGYGQGFTIGLIMASSSVAVIIPPSIGMIVYGSVTGTSVGELFVAGFFPGLVYGMVFMIYAWWYAKKKGVKLLPKADWATRFKAFKSAAWALGIPVVIIGGIYGGVCTPTEVAGIATIYAAVIALFVYREMDIKDLWATAYQSAMGTAQVMVILAGAGAFSWLMSRYQVPGYLSSLVTSFGTSETAVLLVINVLLLIAGMFIDPASIQTIMSPLFLPIATKVGVSPVHLGIIMVVNGAIGMFTPPFGLNLFVASSCTGIGLGLLIRTVLPWILLSVFALLLITYIPAISMFLPDMLYR